MDKKTLARLRAEETVPFLRLKQVEKMEVVALWSPLPE